MTESEIEFARQIGTFLRHLKDGYEASSPQPSEDSRKSSDEPEERYNKTQLAALLNKSERQLSRWIVKKTWPKEDYSEGRCKYWRKETVVQQLKKMKEETPWLLSAD